MAEKFKVVVQRNVETKDKKKKFDVFKIIDEENGGRKVDTVMCKSVDNAMLAELRECNKAYITGNITVNRTQFEYPKAFVRTIDTVEKIC